MRAQIGQRRTHVLLHQSLNGLWPFEAWARCLNRVADDGRVAQPRDDQLLGLQSLWLATRGMFYEGVVGHPARE